MKRLTLIPAILFAAAMSSLSMAYAADADKMPADAPKKMQPHSHMQEKTGIAPKPADGTAEAKKDTAKDNVGKTKPEKDRSRHLHPRDGK